MFLESLEGCQLEAIHHRLRLRLRVWLGIVEPRILVFLTVTNNSCRLPFTINCKIKRAFVIIDTYQYLDLCSDILDQMRQFPARARILSAQKWNWLRKDIYCESYQCISTWTIPNRLGIVARIWHCWPLEKIYMAFAGLINNAQKKTIQRSEIEF